MAILQQQKYTGQMLRTLGHVLELSMNMGSEEYWDVVLARQADLRNLSAEKQDERVMNWGLLSR
jgi:hypothetical protein